MRHVKFFLVSLAVLLIIGGAVAWPMLSTWGGPYLLSIIQTNLRGKITAKVISGNLISGVIYQDLVITGPDGRVFLQADQAFFRLSLWSIPALHLDIADFGLKNSNIQLVKGESGRWNYTDILKPAGQEPPPTPKGEAPPAPGMMARIKKFIFRKVNFDNVWTENGKITVTDVGVATIYKQIDLKSTFTLLDWGEQTQKIAVKFANLGFTAPQGRAELETKLSYGLGLAKIDKMNLKLGARTILSMQGELCKPLGDLTCKFSGKVGPVQGAVIHEFWSQWPAAWDLTGNFSFSSTPEGANLESRGKIGQADYMITGSLNAKVKPAVFELDADLKGLTTAQLKELKDFKTHDFKGLSPLNARLQVEGTGLPWNPESVRAHLKLDPFQYRETKVDKVELNLSGNARRQELQIFTAGSFGSLNLSANGHLLPLAKDQGLAGDLAIQTGNFQPAQVGLTQLRGTMLTSRFTGKFLVPPSLVLSQASLSGALEATGRINNRPLENLTASFALEGRKLTISQATVQSAGLTASLRGTVTEAGVNVAFTAAAAGSRSMPLPPGPAFTSLTAQGTIQGSWKAPQIAFTAQAQKLSIKNVSLESATLSGTLSGLPPQAGNLQLTGSQLQTPAGTFNRINLTASGVGGQWQFQAAATSPKLPKFEMAGTADLATRPLALQVSRLNWHSKGLAIKNKTPFEVRFMPGWEITTATFQIDGGTVIVAGLARDQELSGVLEVRDLNAGLLAPLGLAASGKLNGRLTLAGNPRSPIINGQIALTGGKIKDMPIQTLTTTLAYHDNQALVSGYLESGPQHSRLVWKGMVPLELSLLPFKFVLAQDGLDLRVQSERVDLSLLTIFSNEVEQASGSLDMLVEAKGNPRQPRVSGYLRWSAGSLFLRQAGTPYRLVAGEIRLQGDRIIIPSLILESNGTLRLSGEIALAGPIRVQSRLQADNFQLLNRGGNEMWASGAIDLDGPLSGLVARGRLLVPKAQLRSTFFRSGKDPDVIILPLQPTPKGGAAPGLYRSMTINVTIDAPNNVFLKDPMGKVELTAHLEALKKPEQQLALGGNIRALHGTLDIEEKTFTVERAILTLPGAPGKPILVDAKATHEMDEIILILSVNGTVSNPQIHLESQPPLPPADVLSYLVFGAPAATLTKEQYIALGAQQLGVLGGISTGKINEILGSTLPFLGGLKVKSGMVSGRPTVGIEKEVVKNVSVFAIRNLNEERGTYEQQVGVQYKFNKNLSIESQYGTRNSGADVFFNYDW